MTEATIIKHVRFACVLRDGYCRVARILGTSAGCSGASEWAHFGPWQRWRTMGQKDPEQRHCTAGSFMACHAHHMRYDGKYLRTKGAPTPIQIEALSDRYADGPLAATVNGIRHEEAA